MDIIIYTKKYGVVKLQNGRYAIATDVDEEKGYAHVFYDLHYAKLNFALKKADEFLRNLHKNYMRNKTQK